MILILSSINSFSQTVTIDSITAKKIIIELIEFDACKAELEINNEILLIQDKKLANLKEVLYNKENQLRLMHEVLNNSEKIVLKHKKETKIYKIVAIASLVVGGILAVK